MLSRRISIFCFAFVFAAAAGPLPAEADEASCNVDKLKSLSTTVVRLLRCSARTIGKADPPDPDCVADADARLAAGFGDAQADAGCASSDDLPDIQTAMHAFHDDLRDLLVVSEEGRRCASGKVRSTAKRTKGELVCRSRAAVTADPPDPDCVAGARSDMADGFAYREQHGVCETTNDAPTVETLVSNFLSFSSARIDGSLPAGPDDLAAVVDGADIDLSWTAPPDGSGLTRARVLRRLDTAPAGPTDPAATIVFDGTGATGIDALTDLLPTTSGTPRVYHYAVYGCDASSNCTTNGSYTTLSPTVRQALVAGGYVIHWRHAAADVCADNQSLGTAETTSSPDWWKSCDANCGTATARQLNATGVADATAIGEAFDTLGIPVGRVLSSEYCRNMTTATLMDFGPAIEESQELTYWVYDEANRCADTFVMLGEEPTAGTNTALIGHAGNPCLPLSGLAWGECAIYKPDGMGGTIYIDRVLKDAWLSLP